MKTNLMEWSRQGVLRRTWHLSDEGRTVATVRARGVIPRAIEVVSSTGAWHARRIWTGLELCAGEGREPVLRYRARLGGGRILRSGRETLEWKREGFLPAAWLIADDEGFPLIRFARTSAIGCARGRIEIEEAGRRLPDLEPLVYLGLILVIRRRRRAH